MSEQVQAELKKRTRRGFLVWMLGAAGAVIGWEWLTHAPKRGGLRAPLRAAEEFNARLWQAYQRPDRLAETFDKSRASQPKVNGKAGLEEGFDPANWSLEVGGLADGRRLALGLADVQRLPKVEVTTYLKCVEGWSTVVTWGGCPVAEFAKAYPPASEAEHLAAETPDQGYYVGLDLASALHPQTLLCYELNGQPLSLEHGGPLRLAVPIKYGIKSLKRIGKLEWVKERPKDYWAERGYDYYSGH
ncbi:MAG: molybdopterin-dependent oxidoreductase [Candidatus Eremiobacteraeota bacterium]|nr:molybdopterin-dependent oxidoreductase [Candidatus Eremiobacteraeota bacterium]